MRCGINTFSYTRFSLGHKSTCSRPNLPPRTAKKGEKYLIHTHTHTHISELVRQLPDLGAEQPW
jgi:hypothetical protein